MRIALFSGNYNYVLDGCTKTLHRLVAYLEALGNEVLVFAPTTRRAAIEAPGTLISVPSIPVPRRAEYRLGLAFPARQRALLKSFAPDLVHLATPDLVGYAALRLARRSRIPAVASFHTRFDTYPRHYGLGWAENYLTAALRNFYEQCERVYVPSRSMADALHQDGFPGNIRIWSRGVDNALFHPGKRDGKWRQSLGFSDQDIVIAFVGRLVREKGLDPLARTIDMLRARGVAHRVLIVGDGPERDTLRRRLAGAVFTGFLEGDALARAYASADIFFNPSLTETFGNVTLEAMASGLPTLCADATGSRSLVVPNATGLIAPADDASAFAEALAILINNHDLRDRMRERARAESLTYDWNKILSGLFTDYLEVVHEFKNRTRATGEPNRVSGEARLDWRDTVKSDPT